MTGLVTKMEGVAESWVGGMMDDASGAPWAEGRVSCAERYEWQ